MSKCGFEQWYKVVIIFYECPLFCENAYFAFKNAHFDMRSQHFLCARNNFHFLKVAFRNFLENSGPSRTRTHTSSQFRIAVEALCPLGHRNSRDGDRLPLSLMFMCRKMRICILRALISRPKSRHALLTSPLSFKHESVNNALLRQCVEFHSNMTR